MCLPIKPEQSDSPARSLLGIGALMMLACLAGPALAGAIGALCAAVPAVLVVLRGRSARRTRTKVAGAGESARG